MMKDCNEENELIRREKELIQKRFMKHYHHCSMRDSTEDAQSTGETTEVSH